jgi:hypothetical protein
MESRERCVTTGNLSDQEALTAPMQVLSLKLPGTGFVKFSFEAVLYLPTKSACVTVNEDGFEINGKNLKTYQFHIFGTTFGQQCFTVK